MPNLPNNKKVILLHNISLDNIKTLLEKYAKTALNKKKAACKFCYAALPDNKE